MIAWFEWVVLILLFIYWCVVIYFILRVEFEK